jgi:hypothetical protein
MLHRSAFICPRHLNDRAGGIKTDSNTPGPLFPQMNNPARQRAKATAKHNEGTPEFR